MEIKLNEEMKNVTYFGHDLIVQKSIRYIAMDKSGDLWGYECKPSKDTSFKEWEPDSMNNNCFELGKVVDPEMSWKESRVKV